LTGADRAYSKPGYGKTVFLQPITAGAIATSRIAGGSALLNGNYSQETPVVCPLAPDGTL
jgi:hypothetical protein